MKKVQVKFETPNGNEVDRMVNTSGSVKKAANDVAKEFNFWKMLSYKVVKEW